MNIKVIAIPEPDDPDILRSVAEWVNEAYAVEIVSAATRLNRRVRVAAIEKNEHLKPYFLQDGTIVEVVFYLHVETEQLRYHVRLDNGNIINLGSLECVLLPNAKPAPLPAAELPSWFARFIGLGPEEKQIGKHVRITDANRFPGKYLEDGVIRQVFTNGKTQSFVVYLSKTGELLKDVLESEVRFL